MVQFDICLVASSVASSGARSVTVQSQFSRPRFGVSLVSVGLSSVSVWSQFSLSLVSVRSQFGFCSVSQFSRFDILELLGIEVASSALL